jgi:hypothetical protein
MWFEAKFYSRAQIDEFISEYERQFPGGLNDICIMLEDASFDHKRKYGVYLERMLSVIKSSALFKERLQGNNVEKAPSDLFEREFSNLSHDFSMRMRDICEARQVGQK